MVNRPQMTPNRYLQMVKALTLLVLLSGKAWAYTCYDTTGTTLNSRAEVGGKASDVYVNLQPTIEPGQNLVVDLSASIFCKNDQPETRNDAVNLQQGSTYSGVLANFTGSLKYYGANYSFPLNTPTSAYNFTTDSYSGWDTQLYLTPISTASGIVINSGDLIATLLMYQVGSNISNGGSVFTSTFTWNIYANNSVVVPTGTCDVSARDITVTLPDYPGSAAIPLSVYCSKDQKLGYYLTGTTADTANSIFTNTATASAAAGIGVQLMRNGTILPANSTVSLGTVSTSAVSLGLTASYARTSGQVTAGNVQSIVGVTFVYE